MKKLAVILAVILALLLILLAGLLIWEQRNTNTSIEQTVPVTAASETTAPTETEPPEPETTEAEVTAPTETQPTEPEPTETLPPEPAFSPNAVDSTDPGNWGIQWSIIENGIPVESFQRDIPITFEGDYFAFPGVAGFRSDYNRTNGSYGTVDIQEGSIKSLWRAHVGALGTTEWIGCGWTGQPLVVQWDSETKAIMNLYDSKKEKENLVEAIYPKMDGYVHFLDMEDGSFTRDPLFLGNVFKGSGALDPRGYPILYVGAGIPYKNVPQHFYAVSLIDGQILFEFSGQHSLSPRGWCAFDSGPLIDAETDTLIWACENGMLYTMKLNTRYDKETGMISMNPDAPVIGYCTHNYNRKGRNAGFEASVTAAKGYVYLADNSGMLLCVDINTMELIWAQDIKDDINATPLLDWEGDNGYLYIAPSLEFTNTDVPLYKINAETGEIVWQYHVKCVKDKTISGGALASPLLGRSGTTMEDLVIFSIASTPGIWNGKIIAFHKVTGEIVWEYQSRNYMWSSPIALYTEDGKGYIFQACTPSGYCLLMDGQTGEVLNTYKVGRTIESTPVAFGNHILVGSRTGMHLLEIN